jgi:hypothetical protein
MFSKGMENKTIYVYKVTISASAGNSDVATGTTASSNTPLFPSSGSASVGSTAQPIILKYTEDSSSSTPHKYKLDGDKYKATSLAALYAMKSE